MPETDQNSTPPHRPRSLNALQHGCCAATPVLPGEDPHLWHALEQSWLEDYQPHTATATRLVTEAALACWSVARTRRCLEQVEHALAAKEALAWTNEDHQTYSRFLRYHTAARRAFQSALQSLEYLRKSRMQEQEARRRAEERTEQLHHAFALAQAKLSLAAQKQADAQENKEKDRALKRELAQHKAATASTPAQKKKKPSFWTGEQWIEVHTQDGQTRTTYHPTNEALQQEIQRRIQDGDGAPALIYRRLSFPHGLPAEYAWCSEHDPSTCETTQAGQWCQLCTLHERGGYGLQRLLYPDWLAQIEAEAQTPGQHLQPTGRGSFPQPKERGGTTPFAQLKADWDQMLAQAEHESQEQPRNPKPKI